VDVLCNFDKTWKTRISLWLKVTRYETLTRKNHTGELLESSKNRNTHRGGRRSLKVRTERISCHFYRKWYTSNRFGIKSNRKISYTSHVYRCICITRRCFSVCSLSIVRVSSWNVACYLPGPQTWFVDLYFSKFIPGGEHGGFNRS